MTLIVKPKIIIHRKITWLLLFAVSSLIVVSWLICISKRNIGRTNYRISQTYEVIGTIQNITLAVAESGSDSYRYFENGDQQAALRLRSSHRQLLQSLDSLQRLTRTNCDQCPAIALLRNYILEKNAREDSLLLSTAVSATAQRRAALADSTLTAFLNAMALQERNLLTTRKRLNEEANSRTAYGLIVGRIAGAIFMVIILVTLNADITRRKKIQEQLETAIQEAQEAKQMQEQFLANMSHEIRTPMNGIKGMTDLLLSTPLSGKQHELTGIIKSSVNSLLIIINDILDFSKIKAGKLNIEKITFSVKEVLSNATVLFDHRLKKKGLLLQVKIDPAIPDWLTGDPHRLNQILTNLIGNAIKFTDRGQIDIRVTLQERSDEEVVLLFTVTDTGIGIPQDSMPGIFDSFTQAGGDISRRYGGTGLGLTICKQLVQLQGGNITAVSTLGKGSVFSFHLPYGYTNAAPVDAPAAEIIFDYSKLLAGKRFLVAEDNEINQKLIDYVLRKAGGTVELFNNGADAIKYLQHDKIFDLIIMDLQMPEMDGYEATRYIRNDLHMETPIIAMTATAMKGEQLQCLESGMNEYMTKPFEFTDLYKRISGLLS